MPKQSEPIIIVGILVSAVLGVLLLAAPAALALSPQHNRPYRWHMRPLPARLLPAARALFRGGQQTSVQHRVGPVARNGAMPSVPAGPRIVGGTGAVQGQLGFMAFVAYFDSSGNPVFSCSGTLVTSRLVLTAGHCAVSEGTGVPLNPSGYRVVTGAVDWTDAAHRHISRVSRVVLNPAFDPVGPTHDVSLLVLSAPVSQPTVPLWSTGELFGGTSALIAGWGDTYAGDPYQQTLLLFASTVVQGPAYCGQPFFAGYVFDPSSEVCAINPPSYATGTCSGDSGGPLLIQGAGGGPLEVGVTSIGPADCDTATPDFFTSVAPIDPWVRSVAKSTAVPSLPLMTIADAQFYVRKVLAHFTQAWWAIRHNVKLSCSRVSNSRVQCAFTFWSGEHDYYGQITVYYYTANRQVYWKSIYAINWVNDHCYFHTSHPKTCPTHPQDGTW